MGMGIARLDDCSATGDWPPIVNQLSPRATRTALSSRAWLSLSWCMWPGGDVFDVATGP
jgi:hypothetical protein